MSKLRARCATFRSSSISVPGAVVGVVGPPAIARPLARSLVLQLAVAHGPADLLVAAVTAAGSPEPGWLRWLPHARDPDLG